VSDLTAKEQAHVRAAVAFLRARCAAGDRSQRRFGSAKRRYGVRVQRWRFVARLAGVTVDDVLMGRFPPLGTCPYCGQPAPAVPESPTFDVAARILTHLAVRKLTHPAIDTYALRVVLGKAASPLSWSFSWLGPLFLIRKLLPLVAITEAW
jgi:hypothetical protein